MVSLVKESLDMAHDGQDVTFEDTTILTDALQLSAAALSPCVTLLDSATAYVRTLVSRDGRVSARLIEQHQTATHGLAWLATYVEALRQMHRWAHTLQTEGKFGKVEKLLLQIGFGEYLAQILGGIPISQSEILRLQDIVPSQQVIDKMRTPEIITLTRLGNSQTARSRLVILMQEQSANITTGACGLDDELEMIREQFYRYAAERVEPYAHEWHLKDELIPMEIIEDLAEMGVFGLTIPEEFGGFGLSKASMAVVSEELSRGYIGVGSLATRSEIAAELIMCGGTQAQKQDWLPKLASAEILPTAVFTEPNTGSDLGALRTRATKDGDDYRITGNKTWITHAARTHVMTLLARTNPDSTDHRGLSMFLAEKTPGTDAAPFPTTGMTGG
jgi:(2S)-methylsuccinyl-CoA dehydrogenase